MIVNLTECTSALRRLILPSYLFLLSAMLAGAGHTQRPEPQPGNVDVSVTLSIIPQSVVVGGILSARISVTRSGYTNWLRVDLYKALSTRPGVTLTGDQFFIVDPGSDAWTREFRFRAAGIGTFTAWAQVDTGNQLAETDEENNIASAAYTVVGLTVSGYVRNPSGEPLPGVTVVACSTSCTSTVTAASGSYRLRGLKPGVQEITPSRDLFEFRPSSRALSLNVETPNVYGVNFVGTGVDISIGLTLEPSSEVLGSPMTAVISVTRSAETKRSFWVDFYPHRTAAPGAKMPGAAYFLVPPGSASVTHRVTFTPSAAGTFRAWAQADTDRFVDEINEANNITGPISYTVTPPIGGSQSQSRSISVQTAPQDVALPDDPLSG